MRRLLLVLALAAATLVLPSMPRAAACSCARSDVRESLARVDGAFVGTFLSRGNPEPPSEGSSGAPVSSGTPVRYHYQVERAVKGDIPSGTIDVWAPVSGASCGLETPVGQRTGLLLRRDGDRWTSSLCSQTNPDVLLRAAEPLPPPPGKAPPAVLVGTTHGPGRMLSLDGLGRVVAYGTGDGIVYDIAFCPGGKLLAEAYAAPSGQSFSRPGVAIRSTGDLVVAWERFLTEEEKPQYSSARDLACRSSDGDEVLALVVDQIYSETQTRNVGRILTFGRQGPPRTLWQGEAMNGIFSADGRVAYVSGAADGRDLLRIDLGDLAHPVVQSLARLPAGTDGLALSPDGRHLAGVATNWSTTGTGAEETTRAVVVDLAGSPPTVAETQLGPRTYSPYSVAVWNGSDRVVFAPSRDDHPLRIFDAGLRETASWPGWGASRAAVVGDYLVGLSGAQVLTALVSTGPAIQWANLESGEPGTIVAFPGGAKIEDPSPPTTTSSLPPKPAKTTTAPPSSTTTSATTASAPEPETPAGDPSTTTTTGSEPPTTDPAPGGEVVAQPENHGGGTSGRPILAGGAGAALLAAGVAGLVRRRRRLPTLPPL